MSLCAVTTVPFSRSIQLICAYTAKTLKTTALWEAMLEITYELVLQSRSHSLRLKSSLISQFAWRSCITTTSWYKLTDADWMHFASCDENICTKSSLTDACKNETDTQTIVFYLLHSTAVSPWCSDIMKWSQCFTIGHWQTKLEQLRVFHYVVHESRDAAWRENQLLSRIEEVYTWVSTVSEHRQHVAWVCLQWPISKKWSFKK